MASLSMCSDDGAPARIVANPIYPLTDDEQSLTFEVLEQDAGSLHRCMNITSLFIVSPGRQFWGRLVELERCESVSPALAFLRERSTLRGRIEVVAVEPDRSTVH